MNLQEEKWRMIKRHHLVMIVGTCICLMMAHLWTIISGVVGTNMVVGRSLDCDRVVYKNQHGVNQGFIPYSISFVSWVEVELVIKMVFFVDKFCL